MVGCGIGVLSAWSRVLAVLIVHGVRSTPECEETIFLCAEEVISLTQGSTRRGLSQHAILYGVALTFVAYLGLIILSCSLRVACRTGANQKVTLGVRRTRGAGPVTHVDAKEFVSSLTTKSKIFLVSFVENRKADSPTMKFPNPEITSRVH